MGGYKIFLWVFLFVSCTYDSAARHIVGGEVTYECIGLDTISQTVRFEITVRIYRDTEGGGAPFDDPARFGLYRGSGANWTFIQAINRSPIAETVIDTDTGNPCLTVPEGIGVEEGIYQFEIEVPISNTDSYQVVYQRCCRNNTIFNIVDPDVTGATYAVEISPLAQRVCDNSPSFDDFPPVIICAEALLNFDHSATDQDGDQVVYEFCNPIAGGGIRGVNGAGANECDGITPSPMMCPPPYDDVAYRTLQGFTVNDPLGPGVLTLNQQTGLLQGRPLTIGQFVVGICASTFRNGELIGTVSRDFQFNVTPCEIEVQANVASDDIINGRQFIINSCGENTVFFDNQSIDATKIISYDWEFYIGADTLMLTTRDATVTFPDTGQYTAFMFLNRNEEFADCKDTAEISVNIFPSITAEFDLDYDTCVAGPVDFTDESFSGAGPIQEWEWEFDVNGNTSDDQNPSHRYTEPGEKVVTLTVTDENRCSAIHTETFSWFPVPPLLIIEPSQFVGCVPSSITFTNLSSPIDETYDVIWNFGDGNSANEISPTHIYEETGVFAIDLTVTSPIGCEISQDFITRIEILESPVAGFSFSPENPSNFNKTVSFFDESQGAESVIYIFEDVARLERNPTYTFQDTGVIEVLQVVTHSTGCTDTASVLIDIEPIVTLHLPNAFTPNDDGLNDDFRGKGFFDGFRSYRMQIWNRWGEKIFETEDPTEGWNGQKQGTNILAPGGVYVYTVEYAPPRGSAVQEKGHVTLIR